MIFRIFHCYLDNYNITVLFSTHNCYNNYTGMRLGFDKNSGKFYVAIDSNPIQHHRFKTSSCLRLLYKLVT